MKKIVIIENSSLAVNHMRNDLIQALLRDYSVTIYALNLDKTTKTSFLSNGKFIVASRPGWVVLPAFTPVKVSKLVLCATSKFLISM